MAELIKGKDYLSFFRERALHETQDAAKLRFMTESSVSMEKETEATITKDGVINTIMDGENTAEFTSLAYRDDEEVIETWKTLQDMFKRNALVEFWNVDVTADSQGKYDATYYQGYFTSFEISAPAEGSVELSYSFAINGTGAEGQDTLTETQLASVKAAQYEYESLKATGELGA